MTEEKKENGEQTLSEQENKIIEHLRDMDYGEIRIVINGGKPLRVEEVRKSIML